MYADKHFLRKKYAEQRKSLSLNELAQNSKRIAERLKKLPLWEKDFYHLFLPISRQNEIDTFPILEHLKECSKKIVLCKTDFSSGKMDCFLWHPKITLSENAYGIIEPLDGARVDPLSIEVAFIPLLAFDLKGNRLGYGKGFYDRFLASCSQDLHKVGLSIFEPSEHPLSVHPGDVPLNRVVTPYKTYLFS